MTLREYTKSLLASTDCPENAYYNVSFNDAQKDLIEYYTSNNIEVPYDFSISEIAEMLIDIGEKAEAMVPKPNYKYTMIWDNGNCVDGENYETFDEALFSAQEIYIAWQGAQYVEINKPDISTWTQDDIESWDYMIDNCCCYIIPYGSEDEDEEYYLSNDELIECGWVYYEDMLKAYMKFQNK